MSQSLALQLGNLDELAQLPFPSAVRFVGNARLGNERDIAGAEVSSVKRANNKCTICSIVIMDDERISKTWSSFG